MYLAAVDRRELTAEVDGRTLPVALPPGVARGIAVCEAFGSFRAEVIEARIEGGELKVDTVYAVLDCGFAVNPDLVESQVEGRVIFGLTAALWVRSTSRRASYLLLLVIVAVSVMLG